MSSSVPLSVLVGITAWVAVGGLFAAADAAVTALPEPRLRALLEHTPKAKRTALERVLSDRQRVLSRLLVGRVVCVVGATVLAAHASSQRWPRFGPLVAGALVALVYALLTDVATTLVRGRAMELAPFLLRLVRPFELAILPLAAPISVLARRFMAFDTGRASATELAATARLVEAEVGYLIEQGQADGLLGQGELLQAAVDFKGKVASDVMVPRTRMVSLRLGTPLWRVLEIITAEGHSRFPVHGGRIDDIVGLLYVKDLFRVVREGGLDSTTLESLVRKPALFVQEGQEVSEILKEMRQRRLHIAVVLDEFGGTSGLVTLEDILELLVGDIRDELDDDEANVQDLGGGRLLVDAALGVDELGDRLGVALPEPVGFVSVGGLLMEQLGRVPEVGVVVRVGSVEFAVRDADERRIRRVEVRRVDEPGEP